MTKGLCHKCEKYKNLTRKKFHMKGFLLYCEDCFREESAEQVDIGYISEQEVVGEDLFIYKLSGKVSKGIAEVIERRMKNVGNG